MMKLLPLLFVASMACGALAPPLAAQDSLLELLLVHEQITWLNERVVPTERGGEPRGDCRECPYTRTFTFAETGLIANMHLRDGNTRTVHIAWENIRMAGITNTNRVFFTRFVPYANSTGGTIQREYLTPRPGTPASVVLDKLMLMASLLDHANITRAEGTNEDTDARFAGAAQIYRRARIAYDRRDWAAARTPMTEAAELGHPRAQLDLGFMYRNGYGVRRSSADAMTWYRRSAEQGNAHAMRSIGYLFHQGYGVVQNHAEAVRWYRLAAEEGDAMAMRNVALMYENGWGVPQNRAEAIRWYRQAAAAGDDPARGALRRLGAGG